MRHILAFFAVIALAAPSFADTMPVKRVTIEGISEYRLENGLRILLAPDETKPTTTVNVTYQVGSRMEKYGETGMAHLLEHLLFKGSPAFPGKTIVQEFAKRGMRFNGSTWYDRTNYFETFTASDDNLDWALKMEADRMVNSNIAREDLDSEMTVVRNEMEQGENSPFRILWEKMTASAFQWHNYGKSTIGARADVENVNIAHLQAFYRNFYQPDNAVLIVTGKFDEGKILPRIAQYFGAIAKPGRTLEPLWTVEPVQDGARMVTLSRTGDTPIVAALYHIPQAASDDFPALAIYGQILADTPNGRLYRALVEKKLAAGINGLTMPMHDPGYMLLVANLEQSQPREKALQTLLATIENTAKAPITEAELKRAQTALLNEIDKTLDDPAQFGVRLSEAIAAGDWRLFFVYRDRIKSASLADIQRVAGNYFKESNRTAGMFIPTAQPDRAVMPAPVDVEKLVNDYKGNDAVAAGESFDPSPANIESRTRRYELANGMKVAQLVKQTRGNRVSAALLLNIGDVDSLKGKKTIDEMTANMLERGAGKLSRKEIADRLQELKATLTIRANGDQLTLNFETKRDKLAELLDLLDLMLVHPNFPESELESLKSEMLSAIESRRHLPDAVATNLLQRHDNPYPKGDIRYVDNFDEQEQAIRAVKANDLRAFHDQFFGADHAQLALVGDFDAAATEAQLQSLFGKWKARQPYQRVPHPFHAINGASEQVETPDKANGFYVAGLSIKMQDDDPQMPALMLGDRILGSGGLKSRIVDRLRQKDGISYGAGSALIANPYEDHSVLSLYAIYAPENLGKLKKGITDVITALLQEGITEQELQEAKSGLLQNWTISRTQDAGLASQMANQLRIGRKMDFIADREARVQAASLADVNDVLRAHLSFDHLVQIYAGDFAKADRKSGDSTASH